MHFVHVRIRAISCQNSSQRMPRPSRAPRSRNTQYNRACAVETHIEIRTTFCDNFKYKMLRPRWSTLTNYYLYCYRKNPCVDTLFGEPKEEPSPRSCWTPLHPLMMMHLPAQKRNTSAKISLEASFSQAVSFLSLAAAANLMVWTGLRARIKKCGGPS